MIKHILWITLLLTPLITGASLASTQNKAEASLETIKGLAEKGDSRAQFFLGALYYQGRDGVDKDLNKALLWFNASASQNEAQAQSILGKMYFNGEGVKADAKTAFDWYKKAASQNLENAQLWTADLLFQGLGVTKNPFAAYQWWYVAAKNGNKQAATTIERFAISLQAKQLSQLNKLGEELYKKVSKK